MFFIKPSEIVLDCFTADRAVFEFSKPKHSVAFIPPEWKRIPKTYREPGGFHDQPTMKRCVGFIDYYRNSITIPMWSDFSVEVGPAGSMGWRSQFSDGHSNVEPHPIDTQTNGWLNSTNHLHLKLMSPWVFNCKQDVKWLFTEPAWNNLFVKNYKVLSGVVSYKYQAATHVNILFFRKENTYIETIKFDSALATLFPLTDKKIKIATHLVSTEEYSRRHYMSTTVTFTDKYQTLLKKMKGIK